MVFEIPYRIESYILRFLRKKAIIFSIGQQESCSGLLKYKNNVLKGVQRKVSMNRRPDKIEKKNLKRKLQM